MTFLLDPNVAYVMLVVGMVLAILALFTPGTGVLEIGALIILIMAGFSIYNLPFNLWALIVLVLGVFPFLLALRRSRHWLFLIISAGALVCGSIFLFRAESGAPAINPALATVVSLSAVGLLWVIGRKGIEAINKEPSHDLSRIIGAIGDARTDITVEHGGSVYVMGEEWAAISNEPITAGSKVRVNQREGLFLRVELYKE